MTEVYAGTVIRLEIVNGETDVRVVVAESPPAPSSTNPRSIFDFQFEFQNLQFPEPGLYFVRFFGNDHPLLERPIEVIRMNGGEEGDDSHDDD